jgi:hypothetical protein
MASEKRGAYGGAVESPTQRLRSLIAERFKRVEERRFASRVCSESLAALRAVRAERPDLRGDDLYEAAISRRVQIDSASAHAVMWRTHASLEDWGSNRTPRFIDVVKYMIVSEYLGQESEARGISIDLGAFLARRIDPYL